VTAFKSSLEMITWMDEESAAAAAEKVILPPFWTSVFVTLVLRPMQYASRLATLVPRILTAPDRS
jgi:hypothetical protein